MTATWTAASRPTLADVAREAGVSCATASRVLNSYPKVRPDTRRLVERTMVELGYVRNRAARQDQHQHTGSVALVVCEEGVRLFADPFFARILWGASQALVLANVQLVLLTAQSAKQYQASVARYLRSGHVDGALFVSMHGRHALDTDSLGIPVVFAGRPLGGQDTAELCYVDSDNQGGAVLAVRHLIAGGRRVVATMAGPRDMAPGIDRLAGYRTVMAEAGLDTTGLVVYGDFGHASGEHGVLRLLERRPDLDAVFASSDLMALGVLRGLRRAGRKVPDDVAVVGFDDSPLARHTDPPLTTVRQPIEEMGVRGAEELLGLIAQRIEAPRRILLPTELVTRDSA